MKTLITITVAALICLAVAGPTSAAPKLTVDHPSFDFGYAPQNAKLSHTFWLRAEGDDSLRIIKVVPGCGCTKAPLERSLLAVGDSTRLEIVFSTGNRQGKNSKSPEIQTNEGQPYQHVHITTDIVTRQDSTYPIIIAPYKLTFGQYTDKPRPKMTFAITNVSPGEIKIELVDQPSELFAVLLPQRIAAGERVEGSLLLTETGLANSFEKSFTIELNDEQNTRFTVPVKHDARPARTVSTTDAAPR